MHRATPIALAIALVIASYALFGSLGRFEFRRIQWDQGFGRPAEAYYASLGEGFLRGRVSMAHEPDPRLKALPDPFDFDARHDKIPYLWDASYFNGRYYLYFSPLPSLLIYIPYHLLAGNGWPPDQLAATLFAVWAFVMLAAFVARSLAGRRLFVPLPVWLLLLGLGNVVAFVLPFSRTYEVSIFCGMAMTATWAYAMLRFLESPTRTRLIWAAVWLAFSIAARPNLGLLLLVFAIAVASLRKRAAVALIPLAIVGSTLLLYNYVRYQNPFEFGVRYQLTYMDMANHRVCSVCGAAELVRVINSASHYVFWPPTFGGEFPFVDLRPGRLDARVSFDANSNQIAGLAALNPLAAIGSVFALLLLLRRAPNEPRIRAGMFVVAAGWLVLLGLSTCWFVSARYSLDFMMLIIAGAIVCIEAGFAFLADAGVSLLPLRILAVALACYSIATGFLLGFEGTLGEFAVGNPELFQRLSALFQ